MVFSVAFNTFVGVNLQINQKISKSKLNQDEYEYEQIIEINDNYFPKQTYNIFCTDFFEFKKTEESIKNIMRVPKIDFGKNGCFQKIASEKIKIFPHIDPETQRVLGLRKRTSRYLYNDYSLLGFASFYKELKPIESGKNGIFLEQDALVFNDDNPHFQNSIYGKLLKKYKETKDYSYMQKAIDLKEQFLPELVSFIEDEIAKKLNVFFQQTEFYITFQPDEEVSLHDFFIKHYAGIHSGDYNIVTLATSQMSWEDIYLKHSWMNEFINEKESIILEKNFKNVWNYINEFLINKKLIYDKKLFKNQPYSLTSSQKSKFNEEIQNIFNSNKLFSRKQKDLNRFLNNILTAKRIALFFDWIFNWQSTVATKMESTINWSNSDSSDDLEPNTNHEDSSELRLWFNSHAQIKSIFQNSENLRSRLYAAWSHWVAETKIWDSSYSDIQITYKIKKIKISSNTEWTLSKLKTNIIDKQNHDVFYVDDLLEKIENKIETIKKYQEIFHLYHTEGTDASLKSEINDFIDKLNALYYKDKIKSKANEQTVNQNNNDEFLKEFTKIKKLPSLNSTYKTLDSKVITNNLNKIKIIFNQINWFKNIFFKQNMVLYRWLRDHRWSWNDLIGEPVEIVEEIDISSNCNSETDNTIEKIRCNFKLDEWKTFLENFNETVTSSNWKFKQFFAGSEKTHFTVLLKQNLVTVTNWHVIVFLWRDGDNYELRKFNFNDKTVSFSTSSNSKTITKNVEEDENKSYTIKHEKTEINKFIELTTASTNGIPASKNNDWKIAFNNLITKNRIIADNKGQKDSEWKSDKDESNTNLKDEFFKYLFNKGICLSYIRDERHDFKIEEESDNCEWIRVDNKIFENYTIFDLLFLLTQTEPNSDKNDFKFLNRLFDIVLYFQSRTLHFLTKLKIPDYSTVEQTNTAYNYSTASIPSDVSTTPAETDPKNFFDRFPAFRRYHIVMGQNSHHFALYDNFITLKNKKITDVFPSDYDSDVYQNYDVVSFLTDDILKTFKSNIQTSGNDSPIKKTAGFFNKIIYLNNFLHLWSKNYDINQLDANSETWSKAQTILIVEKFNKYLLARGKHRNTFNDDRLLDNNQDFLTCKFALPIPIVKPSEDSLSQEVTPVQVQKHNFCLYLNFEKDYKVAEDADSPAIKYKLLKKYVEFFLQTHIKYLAQDIWFKKIITPKRFFDKEDDSEEESGTIIPSSEKKFHKKFEIFKKINFFENVVMDKWINEIFKEIATNIEWKYKSIQLTDFETFHQSFFLKMHKWSTANRLSAHYVADFESPHLSTIFYMYQLHTTNFFKRVNSARTKSRALEKLGFLPEFYTVKTLKLVINDLNWLYEVIFQNDDDVKSILDFDEENYQIGNQWWQYSNSDTWIDSGEYTSSQTNPEALFPLKKISLDFVTKNHGNWINQISRQTILNQVKLKFEPWLKKKIIDKTNVWIWEKTTNSEDNTVNKKFVHLNFKNLEEFIWLEKKNKVPSINQKSLKFFLFGTRFFNVYLRLGKYVVKEGEDLSSFKFPNWRFEKNDDNYDFAEINPNQTIELEKGYYDAATKLNINIEESLLRDWQTYERELFQKEFTDISNWIYYPKIYLQPNDWAFFIENRVPPEKFTTLYNAIGQLLGYKIKHFSSSYISDGGQADENKLLIAQNDDLNLQLDPGSSQIQYWDEIIIDSTYARNNNIKIGDTLTILGSPDMRIVGIGSIPEFLFPGINPISILSSKKEAIIIISPFFYKAINSQIQHKFGNAWALNYTHYFFHTTDTTKTVAQKQENFQQFLTKIGEGNDEKNDSNYTSNSLQTNPPQSSSTDPTQTTIVKQPHKSSRISWFKYQSSFLPPYATNRKIINLIWVSFNFTAITLIAVVSLIWFVSLFNLLRRKLDETKKAIGILKAQGIRNKEVFLENFSPLFIILFAVLLGWIFAIFLQIPIFATLEGKTSFTFQKFYFSYPLLVISFCFVLVFYFLLSFYFQKKNITDSGIINLINKKISADNVGFLINKIKKFSMKILPFSHYTMFKINYTFVFLIWKKIIGLLMVVIFLVVNFMMIFFLYTTPNETIKKQYENVDYSWNIEYRPPNIDNPFTWLYPYQNNSWKQIIAKEDNNNDPNYPVGNEVPEIYYSVDGSTTQTDPMPLKPESIVELFVYMSVLNKLAINISFLEQNLGNFSAESQEDLCKFVINLLRIDFKHKENCLQEIVNAFLPFNYSDENTSQAHIQQIQKSFAVGAGIVGVNSLAKDELYTGFSVIIRTKNNNNEWIPVSDEKSEFMGLPEDTRAFKFDPSQWAEVKNSQLDELVPTKVIINRLLADQFSLNEGDIFKISEESEKFYWNDHKIRLSDWSYKTFSGEYKKISELDPRAKYYFGSILTQDLSSKFKQTANSKKLLKKFRNNGQSKYQKITLQTKYTDPKTNVVEYIDMLDIENFRLKIGRPPQQETVFPFNRNTAQYGRSRNWWIINIANKSLKTQSVTEKHSNEFEIVGIINTYHSGQIFTTIDNANQIKGFKSSEFLQNKLNFPQFFNGRISFLDNIAEVVYNLGITHEFGFLDTKTITYGGKKLVPQNFHSIYGEKKLYGDFLTFIIQLVNIGLLINLVSTILLFIFVLRNGFEILKDSSVYLNVMGYSKKQLAQQAFFIFFIATFIGMIAGTIITMILVNVFKGQTLEHFSLYLFFLDDWSNYLIPVLLVLFIFIFVFWVYLRSFNKLNLSVKIKEEN